MKIMKVETKISCENCIKDIINLGIQDTADDVNVDIARANYQKYQDELKEIQKNYIKTAYFLRDNQLHVAYHIPS